MSVIVLDLIKSAMRLANILASGETPSGNMGPDALVTMNRLLEIWSVQPSAVQQVETVDFPLTAALGRYTIGAGGAFNVTRPVRIITAAVIVNGEVRPLEVRSRNEHDAMSFPLESGLPDSLTYIADVPLGVILLTPAPIVAYTLRLGLGKMLGPVTLATTLTFATGGEFVFEFELAQRLSAEYGTSMSAAIIDQGRQARAAYRNANKHDVPMTYSSEWSSAGGYSDWRTGA